MSQLAEQMTSVLPTLMLWGGASLIAIMLLAKSAKRRRESLTAALKDHVTKSVGTSESSRADDRGSK